MSFIGLICETKNENYIRQVLREKLKNNNIIFLKEDSIENFKNIKFEAVIIMSNDGKIFSKDYTCKDNINLQKDIIRNIIAKSKCLVVNADEEINLNLLQDTSAMVITYGFNSKSTITASSVKDDEILICVQRNIQDLEGNQIELQEFNIKRTIPKTPTNIVMGIATTLLLYGIQEFTI